MHSRHSLLPWHPRQDVQSAMSLPSGSWTQHMNRWVRTFFDLGLVAATESVSVLQTCRSFGSPWARSPMSGRRGFEWRSTRSSP